MLRKTVNKILKMRKKKADQTLGSCKLHHDYDDEKNADESDATRVFRHAFIDKFESFRHEVNVLAMGNTEFNNTWKDTLGKEGLALGVSVIVGVIALLGAFSILSAAVSAGVSIPVAIVGAVVGVAFYKYRDHLKQKRYKSADVIMDREDISQCIRNIASLLADLYQLQLSSCTIKDAHVLAESCMKAISMEMLNNAEFNLDALSNVSALQAVMVRSLAKMRKMNLDMNLNTNKKFNARGLISHSAYYCKETDEFYQSAKSKSTKYGVLFFDKKADLDDYESILTTTMKHGETWKFAKMRPHEVHALMRSSMFKNYKNDALFEGNKKLSVVEECERFKV